MFGELLLERLTILNAKRLGLLVCPLRGSEDQLELRDRLLRRQRFVSLPPYLDDVARHISKLLLELTDTAPEKSVDLLLVPTVAHARLGLRRKPQRGLRRKPQLTVHVLVGSPDPGEHALHPVEDGRVAHRHVGAAPALPAMLIRRSRHEARDLDVGAWRVLRVELRHEPAVVALAQVMDARSVFRIEVEDALKLLIFEVRRRTSDQEEVSVFVALVQVVGHGLSWSSVGVNWIMSCQI